MSDKKTFKPFAKRIKDGELFSIEQMADYTGYSVQHIRKLCRAEKIGHIRRGGKQFYFTPAHVEGVFQYIKGKP